MGCSRRSQVAWFERAVVLEAGADLKELVELAETDINPIGCISGKAYVLKASSLEEVRRLFGLYSAASRVPRAPRRHACLSPALYTGLSACTGQRARALRVVLVRAGAPCGGPAALLRAG